jgi:hypothetical protein
MGKKGKKNLLADNPLGFLPLSRGSSLASSQASNVSNDASEDLNLNDKELSIDSFVQDFDSKRQSNRINAISNTINILSNSFYTQIIDTEQIFSLLFKCVRREEAEAVLAIKLITIIYITSGKSSSFEKICQTLQSDIKSLPDKLKGISLISLCLISIIEDFNLQLMPLILSFLENEESTDEVVLSALCSLGLVYSFETISRTN